jgi:XRE family aerobic/anaerobic benzoate catabolism transcriptional regulator
MSADRRAQAGGKKSDPASQIDRRQNDDAADTRYLVELGQRVRNLRAVRGMSRKTLAALSGLSERYIAQIETGGGNASIMLLRRIAAAAGVPLEALVHEGQRDPLHELVRDLLRTASRAQLEQVRTLLSGAPAKMDGDAQSAMRDRRVALIGLRGAGKSTVGRLAAERLGWSFVELNQEIESERGFSMTDIFTLYGQDGYRRFEQETLRQIAERQGPMILATGGGIVAEPATLEFLLTRFFTVWMKAAPAEHMSRVRKQGDLRPMANDRSAMTELVTILSSREPLYRRAEAVVDTTGASVEQSFDALVAVIERRFVVAGA